MIILFCVTFVMLRKSGPHTPWAKPVAILCLLLALGLAIGRMINSSSRGQANLALATHQRYQDILTTQLAANLKTRHAGARVVILSPPIQEFQNQASNEGHPTLTEGLQQALENEGFIVTSLAIKIPNEALARFQAQVDPSTDPSTDTSIIIDMLVADLSQWFSPQDFSSVLKQLATDADLVISTLPFPSGIDSRILPLSDRKPAVVLLNTSITNTREAMEQTALDTIVLNQTNPSAWMPGTAIPKHPEEAFRKRYLLVTKSNVASLIGTHPLL